MIDPFEFAYGPAISASANQYGVPETLLRNLVAPLGLNPENLRAPAGYSGLLTDPGSVIQKAGQKLSGLMSRYETTGQAVAEYLGVDSANPVVAEILQKSGINADALVAPKENGPLFEWFSPLEWLKSGAITPSGVIRDIGTTISKTAAGWLTVAVIFIAGFALILFGLYGITMQGKKETQIFIKDLKAGK